ncbi:MAG: UDP-N-acetylmuramoyl-L-alanine--D-glutamate ligase [Flavobacteriales bacterium]|nr:UDP-N-acetylmuramoyl-L-alanine--D-glutamate ligase [Flavobacteriales bacterium]
MENEKRIAVLGGGESGVGAAVLAKQKGMTVYLSDNGEIKDQYKKVLSHHEVEFDENHHDQDRILSADTVVKSPGIPDSAAIVKACRSAGIAVISEIEFAYQFCTGTIIAITGSNGKTTTTMLIGHILRNAGLDVGVAGNIGDSFAAQLAKKDHQFWVLELSSFQLDGIQDFRPHIAVLLNITPDHLDRYDNDFSKYVASKMKIIQNQKTQDYFIYWSGDQVISQAIQQHEVKAQKLPFQEGTPPTNKNWSGGYSDTKHIHLETNNNRLTMSIHDLALQGKHNVFNSMASGLTAKVLNLRKEVVRESLTNFENVEHRLEYVGKVAGIRFINDSKATNINSTWYALESLDAPVIWIAGGVDKGNDYTELFDLVNDRVKAIICLGTDNKKLHKAFEGRVPNIVDVMSADEAVRVAYDLGFKGDTVLLSPACASFDLFENYEDRGHQFKAAVKRL